MTKRVVVCGESYDDAQWFATEIDGLKDGEWDWCSDCADRAFRNYPEMEE